MVEHVKVRTCVIPNDSASYFWMLKKWVQWFSCAMVQLHDGSVVQWFSFTVVQLYGGSVARWFSCTGVLLQRGSVTREFSYTCGQLNGVDSYGNLVEWSSVARWFSYTSVQLYGSSVAWRFRYTVVQLQGFICLWVSCTHTLIHTSRSLVVFWLEYALLT